MYIFRAVVWGIFGVVIFVTCNVTSDALPAITYMLATFFIVLAIDKIFDIMRQDHLDDESDQDDDE